MKLQYMSDLHLEHRANPVQYLIDLPVTAPTLVLAGDITSHNYIRSTLELCAEKWERVIYVPGNHDHYYSSINDIRKICLGIMDDHDNIHCLDKSSIEIDGHTIHGATLWFSDHPTAPLCVLF